MPPPPRAKKIKRPKKILDEDSYTDVLSHIIARDFFPGLLEAESQQEYLDALDSADAAWISSASKRLRQVMTPGRRRNSSVPLQTGIGGKTPTTYVGETPTSTTSTAPPSQRTSLDADMSLGRFQATYTSEDNESFYKLVDRQNQKKADKYAWLWAGNKLPSRQMIKQKEVEAKIRKSQSLVDDGLKRVRLPTKDSDDRPARPDSWDAAPKNGLMFNPEDLEEGTETIAQKAEDSSRMGPRSIAYENTRIPKPYIPQRPTSPTASSIRQAVAGKPRRQDQDSSTCGGGETPRVNGHAFVDDADDIDDADESVEAAPRIDLGPGDPHNPFKLQEQRKRESLHERMVERIAKLNRESSRNGLAGRTDKAPVPRFPSSPRVTAVLTPAAQRLWSKIGTPKNGGAGSSFGATTPTRAQSSLAKSFKRQNRGPAG